MAFRELPSAIMAALDKLSEAERFELAPGGDARNRGTGGFTPGLGRGAGLLVDAPPQDILGEGG